MRIFHVFIISFLFSNLVAAEPKLEEYYSKAIPASEGFVKRLVKNGRAEPWENMGVRALIDHSYLLAMAQRDLPEEKRPNIEQIVPLLNLAEEMQDTNPESRTFGNFRWYWRTPEVTDRNAVEFVASHALPIWFEVRDQLPPEARAALGRMLRRSVDGCLKHGVRSDYTNIAIYNFVHLILLGQAFDRPDAVKEGENRLRAFLIAVWDHGAFEYNSPTYYTVDIDALQLGLRYAKDNSTKRALRALLDYFYTDTTLNWYTPSQRLAGAQSRTYDYVYGRGGVTRMAEFAGLAPTDKNARNPDCLNSFHAEYRPSPDIVKLNEKYPRLIARRWGAAPGQWARSYILEDIALGVAGAPYMYARQNMPLTVDLADYDTLPETPPKHLPRCYFIADGREDPYGVNRYPTSNAGHNKALHMEAFWLGTQRTVDALGVAVYTPRTLNDPVLTNVQSHFVFRKPDAIYLDGPVFSRNPVTLSAEPLKIGDKSVFFRYGSKAFAIRVPWNRDRDGKSSEAYLVDDGNKLGVQRLTVDHWPQRAGDVKRAGDVSPRVSYDGLEAPPGAAFWVRIGSKLDTDEKFNEWCRAFTEAKVEKLDIGKDELTIQVAGIDGLLSVTGSELSTVHNGSNIPVGSEPSGPEGVLELDGKELGRPILEQYPMLAHYVKKIRSVKSFPVDPKGTYWEAETGFSLNPGLVEDDEDAGRVVRVNGNVFWQLDVPEAAEYYLWARVFAVDPEHDSFQVEWAKHVDGKPTTKSGGGAWHIGSGPTWRWIPLQLENEKPVVPLGLDPGTWRLTLRQREPDGMVDRFFLTTDPHAKPE